jgi:hypothetical protein
VNAFDEGFQNPPGDVRSCQLRGLLPSPCVENIHFFHVG